MIGLILQTETVFKVPICVMEITNSQIENKIYTIRGLQIMLNSDLAVMDQVETKRLNGQVKRNEKRFPDSFMFQLNQREWDDLKSQIATSKINHGGRRNLPYVFTEQGVSMLSAVLTSDTAINVSIQIIQAFVAMRKTLGQLYGVIHRLEGDALSLPMG